MNEGLAIILIAVVVILLLVILSVAGRDSGKKKKKKEKKPVSVEEKKKTSDSSASPARRDPGLLRSAGALRGPGETGSGMVRHFPQKDAGKQNEKKQSDVYAIYTFQHQSGQILCPHCGAENQSGAAECDTCGSGL